MTTTRERIVSEARTAGWALEAAGVRDADDDLVRVSRGTPARSALLSFSRSGELFYADGVGICIASITYGPKVAADRVVAYLRSA